MDSTWEDKQELIKQLALQERNPVKAFLKQEFQALLRINREELQLLLRQCSNNDLIYRKGGYLDGLVDGFNFTESVIKKLDRKEDR